ncbi:MAG: cytochrome P450 [Firmicutes bacterium]|nr:cytochrome P450 [Bacillota bacterium]
MVNGLISSIVKSIISSCEKNYFKKLSVFLKTTKIKKTLVEKIENNILSKHGNDIFYNSLDAFLTRENFAKNIINYCFVPIGQNFNSLNNYNTYLTEKFIEENFGYVHCKSQVFQTLNSLSQIIFNIVNDYSDDQTARRVIAHMNEKIEGISDKIDELMIVVNKPEEDQNNRKHDLNNQTDINNYKLSLATYFINSIGLIGRMYQIALFKF